MKNVIRVIRSVSACVCFALLTTSCDNKSTVGTNAADGSSSTPAKRVKIGVSVPAADHGWTAGVIWWANRAMKLHPEIDWKFQTADTGQKQVDQIEAMIADGIEGLVVLPQDVESVTIEAKKAHDRGIYIVNVDRGLTQPIADLHIEGDNKAFGRKSAEYMVDKLGKKGNIVILEGMINQVNTDRVEAAKAVFAQNKDIKILDDQEADWNHEKGLTVMQAMLAKYPHIDAVWAQDDDTLIGATQAIMEAKRQNEMWVLGGAGMKDVIEKVKNKDPMVPACLLYTSVRNLRVAGLATANSFEVRRGEILGFAGLIGAGRTELAEAVVGLRLLTDGQIEIEGKPARLRTPRDAVRAGIAYLSEDRKGSGLTLGMSVIQNTTLVSLKRYCHPWISLSAEARATVGHVRSLSIRAPRLQGPIDQLSGGNQQKIAIAKWLEMNPKVLILDEPTRGVDIGAKEQIYALIQSLTRQGMALILISSELNEVLGMSHRIAVMRAGQIVDIVDAASATEDSLMHLATGASIRAAG